MSPAIAETARACMASMAFLAGVCISLIALLPSAASASGLPVYDGSMDFGTIHGPSDPERFFW